MPTRYIVAVLLVAYASATISSCLADASHHGSCHGDIPLGDVASLVQKRHLNMNERRQEEHYPVQEKNGLVQKDDEHESEAASGQRTNLGHGKKPGPSEVTLLGSDVNNERSIFVPALFDRTECDVQQWVDNRVCEYGSYHEWVSHPGLREGRQNSHNRAMMCADFCHDRQEETVHTTNDNADKYEKSNTFYFSLGWSGDCRCCFQDGIAEWTNDRDNWATWRCVARPVACTMTAWSEWEPCSKSCGSGTRDRWRNVTSQPKFGGEECGPTQESEDCKDSECPVDCELHEWTDWSDCSKSCGAGETARVRKVAVEAQHGGRECASVVDEGRVETKECKEKDCPVEPLFDPQRQVCGNVVNGADNSPVDGVQVKIVERDLEAVTEGGEFCFPGPAPGKVTMTATKAGWVDHKAEAIITDDMTAFDEVVISQKLAPTEWRIILAWQHLPPDLDSITSFGNCTLNKTQRLAEHCGNGMNAVVDHDNIDFSFDPDPETTTIKDVDPKKCGSDCKIYFRVHNTIGYRHKFAGPLIESQAKVKVIHGDTEKANFDVKFAKDVNPSVKKGKTGEGNGQIYDLFWYVFVIDPKTEDVFPCTKAEKECI